MKFSGKHRKICEKREKSKKKIIQFNDKSPKTSENRE